MCQLADSPHLRLHLPPNYLKMCTETVHAFTAIIFSTGAACRSEICLCGQVRWCAHGLSSLLPALLPLEHGPTALLGAEEQGQVAQLEQMWGLETRRGTDTVGT